MGLFCCVLVINQLRRKAEELAQSLAEAEGLAQKIIDFEVNEIGGESDNRIVQLMLQIAANLKQYRPYLPAHLFAPEGVSPCLSPSAPTTRSLRAQSVRTTNISDISPMSAKRLSAVVVDDDLFGDKFDQAIQRRTGTLLYIFLTDIFGLANSAVQQVNHHCPEAQGAASLVTGPILCSHAPPCSAPRRTSHVVAAWLLGKHVNMCCKCLRRDIN